MAYAQDLVSKIIEILKFLEFSTDAKRAKLKDRREQFFYVYLKFVPKIVALTVTILRQREVVDEIPKTARSGQAGRIRRWSLSLDPGNDQVNIPDPIPVKYTGSNESLLGRCAFACSTGGGVRRFLVFANSIRVNRSTGEVVCGHYCPVISPTASAGYNPLFHSSRVVSL
jgi:hypothetical protein